jgi:CheY-like chemotaxis protein
MADTKQILLVVDDDEAVRNSMALVFAHVGYSVRTAEDGFSALAEIRKEIPDILVSDLNMPGMSGFEFLSVVRRRFPLMKVIAMSGAYSSDEIPLGVAADEFYPKGNGVEMLLKILGELGSRVRVQQNYPAAQVPAWIAANGHNVDEEPYVTIACPECLRTFPKSLDGPAQQILQADCVHCQNEILYAVVHPPEGTLALYL